MKKITLFLSLSFSLTAFGLEKKNELRLGVAIPLFELINDEGSGVSYVSSSIEYGRAFRDFIVALRFQGARYQREIGCCSGEFNSPHSLILNGHGEVLVVAKYRVDRAKRRISEFRPILGYGKGVGEIVEELSVSSSNKFKIDYSLLLFGVEVFREISAHFFFSLTLSTTKIFYTDPTLNQSARDDRLSFNIPSPEFHIDWRF